MKEKAIIAAVAENGVIGNSGRLPWRIFEDLTRFRDLTIQNSVIMGRKTFESLPSKLDGRDIIVLSKKFRKEGIYCSPDLDSAISLAEGLNGERIFFAGGAEIYRSALKIADRFYLTEVHQSFQGDVFFPEFKKSDWLEISREDYFNRVIPFSFVEYLRR